MTNLPTRSRKAAEAAPLHQSAGLLIECAEELEHARRQVEQFRASDDACGQIHVICMDAGIPTGHVVARVEALAAAKDAEIVQLKEQLMLAQKVILREMAKIPEPPPCPHCGRLVLAGRCCAKAGTPKQDPKDAEIARLKNAAKSRLKCPEGHSPGESRGPCWFCDAQANHADVNNITLRLDDAGVVRGDLDARVESVLADNARLKAELAALRQSIKSVQDPTHCPHCLSKQGQLRCTCCVRDVGKSISNAKKLARGEK